MMRRFLSIGALLLSAALAVVGCAGGAAAPTNAPASPATSAQPPTTMPQGPSSSATTTVTEPTTDATAATSAATPATWPIASAPTIGTPPKANKPYRLGLALRTLSDPFYVTLRDGAQREASAVGVTLNVADAQSDQDNQASQIQDLLSKKVDALMVNPIDSNAIVPSVTKANNAKVPVIALDLSPKTGTIATLIASDNIAGGKLAADFMCRQIGNQGNVVELQGTAGTSVARDRGKGFDDEMAAACSGARIVVKRLADFSQGKATSVFGDILTTEPDIAGVFAQSDEMALGAIEAAKGVGRSGIKLVSFGGTPDAVAALKSGDLAGDIAQQPALMGQLAVDNAVRVLNGETVPPNIISPVLLLTKDNAP